MSHPRGVALVTENLGDEVSFYSLKYDADELVLQLKVAGRRCELTFACVSGFRLLDQADLMEYWAEFSLSNGWLFLLTEGGWLAQEQSRSGFMASCNLALREFLVVTDKECVSVLSCENQPDIQWQEP
ncbi:hypothetical protein KJI95_05165 [Shewanella sp. JM162201]|uniref:Uncharacterized protein n=1 Tax=Shewanella jiangmenensis TaxID=2837387 RepID=A0ABS5V0C0_9GAMM|nr:hypothetical protein [Shewanella jiangmenensis]MBT1443913.1 hypothetical protein [Shewanella jiangmenensis]